MSDDVLRSSECISTYGTGIALLRSLSCTCGHTVVFVIIVVCGCLFKKEREMLGGGWGKVEGRPMTSYLVLFTENVKALRAGDDDE